MELGGTAEGNWEGKGDSPHHVPYALSTIQHQRKYGKEGHVKTTQNQNYVLYGWLGEKYFVTLKEFIKIFFLIYLFNWVTTVWQPMY